MVLNFFLFFRDFFLISRKAVMTYNTRNRSNDATESQEEKKICFNAHFQYSQSKIAGINNIHLNTVCEHEEIF